MDQQKPETIQLCPAQQRAMRDLEQVLSRSNVCVLGSEPGLGKTTVLREFVRRGGGALVTLAHLLDAAADRHPVALEDAFYRLVADAMSKHDVVAVDDLDVLANVVSGGCGSYPRSGFIEAPLKVLATVAQESGKKLVVAQGETHSAVLHARAFYAVISCFTAADYDDLCATFLGAEPAAALDYPKIFRFAPKLNAHQIRSACAWLKGRDDLDTDTFIDYLRSQRMTSNVDLGEVQAVELSDLKGIDDVLQALEINLIVPLENDALAEQLGIRPKRGVLLAGPPGTGKTTIGRALAHRLKGKFFLIDGTFISGTPYFYPRVQQIFEAAKQNAPAVIFIDDSDVIFEDGQEAGLYRYLLTMLDGLQSETAGRVCVMMTAMNVGGLPPALVRSGRVELWLETRLPDERGRQAILAALAAKLPPPLDRLDVAALAGATDAMTGADLKRLVEDAKLLFAFDRSRGVALRPVDEYFAAAAQTVRENKERYAEADAGARRQRPVRPPWYDIAMSTVAAFPFPHPPGQGGSGA